ncbi:MULTISPECIES: hypothetical protein [Paenibacillus]|uniref:hypothetical protein n=1 Tax=Paenibacillus TaxID=44249 RepID=UPI0021AC27EB|nr:hypothetical protein [Paenibacillus illinoisensis]
METKTSRPVLRMGQAISLRMMNLVASKRNRVRNRKHTRMIRMATGTVPEVVRYTD